MKLLIVGASESFMFQRERDYLYRAHGVNVVVNGKAGRQLEECVEPLEQEMQANIDAVLIWALTPWAWKRTFITKPGKREMSVFSPNPDFTLEEVAPLMNKMIEIVIIHNPKCRVYLCIPACKDLYKFNQTRIAKNWGKESIHFLKDHLELNPMRMREHSIKTFYHFESIASALPEYQWKNKFCLKGNDVIRTFYQGERNPPYLKYLQRKSLNLDVALLPDGLHGTAEFVHLFCKQFFWVFRLPIQMKKLCFEEADPVSEARRRIPTVNSTRQEQSVKNRCESPRNRDYRCVTVTSSSVERNQSFTTGSSSSIEVLDHPNSVPEHENVGMELAAESPLTSNVSIHSLAYYQQNPPPMISTVSPLLWGVERVPPPSNIVDIPTEIPSEEVLETVLRDIYNKFMPPGTSAHIKRDVAGRMLQIAMREDRIESNKQKQKKK